MSGQQQPILHLNVFVLKRTVPERVYSTAACASSARVSLQLSVLSLDVSILQQPVLPLDVSVLQQILLPQDMSVPHLTVQFLKSKHFFPTATLYCLSIIK